MAGWVAGEWGSALRRGQPELNVNGRTFRLARHPARVWIAALTTGDPEDVLPGLLDEDDWEDWADVVFSDTHVFTSDTLTRMVGVVTARAAGMPFPAALRLISVAGTKWRDLDGRTALVGLDLLDLPLDRFCNSVLVALTEGAEEKERTKVQFELSRPMPGWQVTRLEPSWDAQDDNSDAFAALARMAGK